MFSVAKQKKQYLSLKEYKLTDWLPTTKSFSTYRESVGAQGTVGTLYRDVPGSSQWAPYIRIAVQQGWMNGYTDGTFRPDNTVTLEEACTAA